MACQVMVRRTSPTPTFRPRAPFRPRSYQAAVVVHTGGEVSVYHQGGTRLASCSTDADGGAEGAGPVVWATQENARTRHLHRA